MFTTVVLVAALAGPLGSGHQGGPLVPINAYDGPGATGDTFSPYYVPPAYMGRNPTYYEPRHRKDGSLRWRGYYYDRSAGRWFREDATCR